MLGTLVMKLSLKKTQSAYYVIDICSLQMQSFNDNYFYSSLCLVILFPTLFYLI